MPNGSYPLPSEYTLITQEAYTPGGTHHNANALDIYAPVGTPIYATAAGKAVATNSNAGYGKNVVITDKSGVQYIYAHMSNFGKTGNVQPGDVIGYVGLTGNTTGAHLHYEVKGGKLPITQVTGSKPATKGKASAGKSASAAVVSSVENGIVIASLPLLGDITIPKPGRLFRNYGLFAIGVLLVIFALFKWAGYRDIQDVVKLGTDVLPG